MHAIDTSVPWFTTVFCGIHIVVTSNFVFEVLYVPRVDRPDYPSHPHLTSISRDELASLFCEKAMLWGGTLNFSTTEFIKGLQFLNMVMTFVLTPRSHYNIITEPRAHFLPSFMEGLSIDFPSHMIEFIMTAIVTRLHVISSSFLQLSRVSSPTCTSPSLPLLISMSWVPLARSLFDEVQHSLLQSGHEWSLLMQPELTMQPLPLNPFPHLPLLPHLGPLSSLLISWSSFNS